tara:strand:+ start:837 stop:1079 length:243 start_codon:yes stop_codon:yes gene_type:complete
MGDIADYYREQELKNCMENPLSLNVPCDYTQWEMKNGKKIYVSNMTDSHLNNSIDMIVRDNWRENWLNPLLSEQKRRSYL